MRLNIRWIVSLGIASLVLALSACTTLSVPSSSAHYQKQSWAQRRQALSHLQQWNIAGAFSIRQPNKSVIASYDWEQKGQNYRIHIQSSLDIYSVNIAGQPGRVTLWRSAKEYFTAQTPEQLMQQQLGWQLPVSSLYYWLRGLPAPGNYHGQWDSYGHLIQLSQAGFTVQFSHYLSLNGVDVPQMLQISNPRVAMRIAIKRWGL